MYGFYLHLHLIIIIIFVAFFGQYGRRFVRKRIECDDSELTLISSHKHVRGASAMRRRSFAHTQGSLGWQVLWYSEDGATKKRFRSRGYDAQGYEITRELPLRLGENWHLAFTRDRGSLRPPETHYLTVFQHLVDQVIRTGIAMTRVGHPAQFTFYFCRS